jgi:hypothetical protein
MTRLLEVRRRMATYGIVATADMAAFPAKAEMDPTLIAFEAFLATKRSGDNIPDRHQMSAWFHRNASSRAFTSRSSGLKTQV